MHYRIYNIMQLKKILHWISKYVFRDKKCTFFYLSFHKANI